MSNFSFQKVILWIRPKIISNMNFKGYNCKNQLWSQCTEADMLVIQYFFLYTKTQNMQKTCILSWISVPLGQCFTRQCRDQTQLLYFCNTIREDAGALSMPNWKKGWAKPPALQHKLHVMVPWKRTTKWNGIAVHIKQNIFKWDWAVQIGYWLQSLHSSAWTSCTQMKLQFPPWVSASQWGKHHPLATSWSEQLTPHHLLAH